MEFKKYQHIERLGKSEVTGLTKGMCYIFPKIDGTNAQVYLNKDNEICAGSRNRVLNIENDNAGFCKAIAQDENIKAFFEKYPQYRLYGEWLVPHTIKTYNNDAWRKFYVFDVMDINDNYLSYDEYLPMLQEFNIDYIPVIAMIENPTSEQILDVAKNTHFLQSEDDCAEGIVIKNYDFVNQFGNIVWGKLVLDEFKDKKKNKRQKLPMDINNETESRIIEEFITDAFILKEVSKLLLQKDSKWQDTFFGEFLGRAWYEFVREESFNMIKKYKMPTINFKVLNKLFNEKCKQIVFNRNQTSKGEENETN